MRFGARSGLGVGLVLLAWGCGGASKPANTSGSGSDDAESSRVKSAATDPNTPPRDGPVEKCWCFDWAEADDFGWECAPTEAACQESHSQHDGAGDKGSCEEEDVTEECHGNWSSENSWSTQ